MATYTPTSSAVSAGQDALASQYNALRTDLSNLLTAIFGAAVGGTWTLTTAKFDTIAEQTAAAGVTADGVLLKDSNVVAAELQATTQVKTDTVVEKTVAAGVTLDGVLLKDSNVNAANIVATGSLSVDSIAEKTSAHGVSIDGVLIKDGAVAGGGNAMFASMVATYEVIVNGIELTNSGAGLALSDNLDMSNHTIKGLNKTIDFLMGTSSGIATIPLPSGFIESECQWMAAVRSVGPASTGSFYGVNASLVGRDILSQIYTGGAWVNYGLASYIIIGMHNRA